MGEQTGDCRAYVNWRHVEKDEPAVPTVTRPDNHLRYWSSCRGCGAVGPLRSDENAAAEDGCDHAYPGWRDMPVMGERPATERTQPLKAWQAEVRRIYPAAWLARKGPVREYRRSLGMMRHVPDGAPGGGYLMAVARPRPASTPTTARPTPTADDCDQAALF